MIGTTAIGAIIIFSLLLHLTYKHGTTSGYFNGWWSACSMGGFQILNPLARDLWHPRGPDYQAVSFIGVGFVLAFLLMFIRSRFLWSQLHPLGYAVSSSWGIHLWSSFMISWVIKKVILKYGGFKGYRKAVPFFLGLILGEFTVGSVWNILGIILDMPMYQFSIG